MYRVELIKKIPKHSNGNYFALTKGMTGEVNEINGNTITFEQGKTTYTPYTIFYFVPDNNPCPNNKYRRYLINRSDFKKL